MSAVGIRTFLRVTFFAGAFFADYSSSGEQYISKYEVNNVKYEVNSNYVLRNTAKRTS